MDSDLTVTLASLRPVAADAVMDLVAAAGVNVQAWSRRQDGGVVENPRANPRYCYEWSFGTGDETRVLCVWHDSLAIENDEIVYRGNMKALAQRLGTVVQERWRQPDVRSRAQAQQKRANEFNYVVQRAARLNLALRVILLEGMTKAERELALDASKVQFRRLDDCVWSVASYRQSEGRDDGEFVLKRAAPALPASYTLPEETFDAVGVAEPEPSIAQAGAGKDTSPAYLDQFDTAAATREVNGQVYVRSAAVRRQALERSGGRCEWCGVAGFRTTNGALYLETHHVIPLAEGGADTVLNVLALCPTDHRRAHFAIDAQELRQQLLQRLVERQHNDQPVGAP